MALALKSQPAYARIRDLIAAGIASGEYQENSQLPTERDMCEQHNVSRITIRHALTLLEQEGLIRKRQGQGIFVCPRRYEQPLNSLYIFSEELAKQNAEPSNRVLSMELRAVGGDTAAKLGLSDRALCHEIKRLSYADAKLYAYEEILVPEALLAGATARDIEGDGLYATMRRICGLSIDRASDHLEAMLAPPDVALALQRKPPLAVVKLARVAFSGERAVEHSTRYILGDKYRFKVTFN